MRQTAEQRKVKLHFIKTMKLLTPPRSLFSRRAMSTKAVSPTPDAASP